MWHEIMLTLVGLGAISSGFQETLSDRQWQHSLYSTHNAISYEGNNNCCCFFFQFSIQVLQDFPLKYFMAADGDLCSLWVFLTAMNSSNVFFHVSFDKKVSMHWKLPNTFFMRLKQSLQLFCFSVIDCTKFHVTRENCKRPSSRERLDLFLNYMEKGFLSLSASNMYPSHT